MKQFKWFLNWSLPDIYTNEGDNIKVYYYGKIIGLCIISIVKDRIIGDFSLTENISGDEYVLYAIAPPNEVGQRWLLGIMLVDYEEGIEKKAKQARNMQKT